jgi:hypothetical protein
MPWHPQPRRLAVKICGIFVNIDVFFQQKIIDNRSFSINARELFSVYLECSEKELDFRLENLSKNDKNNLLYIETDGITNNHIYGLFLEQTYEIFDEFNQSTEFCEKQLSNEYLDGFDSKINSWYLTINGEKLFNN